MTILKWIDYIWFVGESYHRQEKSSGDGETLLMWCWYLDAFLVLITLFSHILNDWIFYLFIGLILLAAPFLFCRCRYTKRCQEEIFTRYSKKKIGRKLLIVYIVIISICCIEVLLLIFSGLWHTTKIT